MYKISGIVSKQVVSLSGAKVLGTVIDVKFDASLKRADSLLLVDCEENDEALLKLPLRCVFSLDGDAVVVKNLSAPLESVRAASNSPVNLPCYNQDGKSLGTVKDVEIDERYRTVGFATGAGNYTIEQLLSHSDSLIIFNDTGAPIKLPRPKARPPRQSDKNISVSVTETAIGSADDAKVYIPEAASAIATPTVISSPPPDLGAPDFSFLIGKRVDKALYSTSGELIAAQGSVITQEVIAKAGKLNKLVHLTLRAY